MECQPSVGTVLLLLLLASSLYAANGTLPSDPAEASRQPAAGHSRRAPKIKRSPYGYIIRGEHHRATFQIGTPDETRLFGNPAGFDIKAFQQSAQSFLSDSNRSSFLQSVPGSVTNGLNVLLSAGSFHSQQNTSDAVVTHAQLPSAFNYRQVVLNHVPGASSLNGGLVLGEKGAPVSPLADFPSKPAPIPQPPLSLPPLPRMPTLPKVSVQPSFEFKPSIRTLPRGHEGSTQYFVLGQKATQTPYLFNVLELPTLNPLHSCSHPFHNHPTVVALSEDPTRPNVVVMVNPINPSQAPFPTLNPPLYTQDLGIEVPQIVPTRVLAQPTLAPPLPLPLPALPPVPRLFSNLPKEMFFWFRDNNKNFTLVPSFNDFIKNYQNPLLITRPVQNTFFRPFIHSSRQFSRGSPITGKGPVFRKKPFVFNYFPALTSNFPYDAPFLTPEGRSGKRGHPSGTSMTISRNLAKDSRSAPAKHVPPKTTTPKPDISTTFLNKDTPDETDRLEDSLTENSKSLGSNDVVFTMTTATTEEARDESGNSDISPLGKKEIKPSATQSDAVVVTKEPRTTIIPVDTSDTDMTATSTRAPSFDKKNSGKSDNSETSIPTTDREYDENGLTVNRTSKSFTDNDYDQLFVDFTDPNSIQKAVKPDQNLTTTSTTTTVTGRAGATTITMGLKTTKSPSVSSTERTRLDEYDDYFVDFFDPHPSGPRPKTSSTTTTTTSTSLKPSEKNETESPTITRGETQALPLPTPNTAGVRNEQTTTTTQPTTEASMTTPNEVTITTEQQVITTNERTMDALTTTKTAIELTEGASTEKITTVMELPITTTINEPTTEAQADAPIAPADHAITSSNETTKRVEPDADATTEVSLLPPPPPTGTTTEKMQTNNADEPAMVESTCNSEMVKTIKEDKAVAMGVEANSTTEESQTEHSVVVTDDAQENFPITANVNYANEKEDAPLLPPRCPQDDGTTTETSASTTEIPEVSKVDEPTERDHKLAGRDLVVGIKGDSNDTSDPSSNDTTTIPYDLTKTRVSLTTVEASTEPVVHTTVKAVPTVEVSTEPTKRPEAETVPTTTSETTVAGTTTKTIVTSTLTTKTTEMTNSEDATSSEVTTTETAGTAKARATTSTTTVKTTSVASTITAQATATSSNGSVTPLMTTEPTSAESFTKDSPTTENSDRRGKALPAPEDNEEQHSVPKTVLINGDTRNYSDVQDNHPVVNDVGMNASDPRKRRAANWFVWLLDSENIGKSFVGDVGRFTSSRDIIYVIAGAVLVSTVFAMMGLYCTLKSKAPTHSRQIR